MSQVIMGCYGIGVTRCISAAIEQNYDENGIIWPAAIAPYQVSVVPVNHKDEEQMKAAEAIYEKLLDSKIEALLDDRAERPGVKLKDSDLMGIPVRIVVGKKIGEGIVEYKERTAQEAELKTIDEAIDAVIELYKNL